MAQLEQMLDDILQLTPDELRQLRQAVDERLAWDRMSDAEREDAFVRDLLRKGVISQIPDRSKATPADQRPAPIVIEGEPLSEQLIRERR